MNVENKKKKILIIEDTPELVKVVSSALGEAGFEVITVDNGTQGVEEAEKNYFNLILLDLVMPGQSGFEVMNAFQTLGVKTPVVIYSNMPADFSKEEAMKMGAVDYIEKSQISLTDLIDRLKETAK